MLSCGCDVINQVGAHVQLRFLKCTADDLCHRHSLPVRASLHDITADGKGRHWLMTSQELVARRHDGDSCDWGEDIRAREG